MSAVVLGEISFIRVDLLQLESKTILAPVKICRDFACAEKPSIWITCCRPVLSDYVSGDVDFPILSDAKLI